MTGLDFKAIASAAMPHLLALAFEVDAAAKREGGEIILRNPRRADANAGSFCINATSGLWADFASDDEGGDAVSWWAHCKDMGQAAAARDLAQRFAPDLIKPDISTRVNPPAPADAPEPDFARYAPKGTTFNAAWCYRDAHGARLGSAMRFDGPKGKDPRPLRWDGTSWKVEAFIAPRPLYNLHLLAEHPGAEVIVCEGEKAASAVSIHFPECIGVTSPGGANAARKASWAPLQGRKVTIWPDHDEPGRKYAEAVSELAREAGAVSVRVVKVPEGFPKNWDLADAIPEGADLRAMLDGAEAVEANAWEHPTLPTPDPWIVGDVGRWLTEEPPPVKWIVEDLIPAGVPGAFAARSNAGKSMTALLIALGLASGRGILGRAVSDDAARGVVYAGLEDDEPEFQRRFRRGLELMQEDGTWTAADDAGLDARFKALFPNRTLGARFALEAQWQNLAEKANAIPGGCGIIILDTLARMSEGDENSASDSRPFVDAQAALVQATGATVIAIHHVGKGNDTPSDKKLWQRLHPETLRGSSAIEAGVRFILTMAALSPQEAATAGLDESSALDGGLVALKLAKASQSEKGHTLLLERRHAGQPGAGFLVPHPDSERALAAIQGEAAVLKLNNQDKVLLAIAEAGHLGAIDQKDAAAQLWPDSKNPKGQWDKHLSGIRRTGWVKELHLTDAGWAHVETLGFRRNRSSLTESKESPAVHDSSAGSLEAEETEEKRLDSSSFHSTPLGDRNGRKGFGPGDEWGAA